MYYPSAEEYVYYLYQDLFDNFYSTNNNYSGGKGFNKKNKKRNKETQKETQNESKNDKENKTQNESKNDKGNKNQKENDNKPRSKREFLEIWTDNDYNDIIKNEDKIIEDATNESSKKKRPSKEQVKQIYEIVLEFIRLNKRKIYGGTALDVFLTRDTGHGIYSDRTQKDLEFFSDTPKEDSIKLADYVKERLAKVTPQLENMCCQAKDARHLDTYKIFIANRDFCDISYVPKKILNSIECEEINGVLYVHPRFILIDQLRIFNNIVVADFKWKQTFIRFNRVQKKYQFMIKSSSNNSKHTIPLPGSFINAKTEILRVQPSEKVVSGLTNMIKTIEDRFWNIPGINETCALTGFTTYNHLLDYAVNNSNQKFRKHIEKGPYKIQKVTVPYIEICTTKYLDTVEKMASYLKSTLQDGKNNVEKEEYYPFIELLGHLTVFTYFKYPIVYIYKCDGYLIPSYKFNGKTYCSFLYLLQYLLTCKFRSYVNRDTIDKFYNQEIIKEHEVHTELKRIFNEIQGGDNDKQLSMEPSLVTLVHRECYTSLIGNIIYLRREFFNLKGFKVYKSPAVPFNDIVFETIGENVADVIQESNDRRAYFPNTYFSYDPYKINTYPYDKKAAYIEKLLAPRNSKKSGNLILSRIHQFFIVNENGDIVRKPNLVSTGSLIFEKPNIKKEIISKIAGPLIEKLTELPSPISSPLSSLTSSQEVPLPDSSNEGTPNSEGILRNGRIINQQDNDNVIRLSCNTTSIPCNDPTNC